MQVKNPNPAFKKPSHHKNRPQFLRACETSLSKCPASQWDGWHLIQRIYSRSKVNVHRFRAIDAIFNALIHHVDLYSGVVQSNVWDIAHATGLATESKKGSVSISRCSRALKQLVAAGIIETQLVYDRVLGCHIPLFINVTSRFWDIVHPEGFAGYERAREKQAAYRNEGLSDAGEWLSITQAKERRRRAHIKTAFAIRRNKHNKARANRLALKSQEKEKTKLRAMVAKDILDEMGDLHGLDPTALSDLVNQRIALYRKISSDPEPTRH